MPEGASLVYPCNEADDYAPDAQTTSHPDHLDLALDIRDAGPEEARWWAAVLAPGQGWQATMASGQDTFFAPWFVRLQPGCRFVLSTNSVFPPCPTAALSFLESLSFLDKFCARRGVANQSQAALAAVLLFPSMGTSQGLQLPAFEAATRRDATLPFRKVLISLARYSVTRLSRTTT